MYKVQKNYFMKSNTKAYIYDLVFKIYNFCSDILISRQM